MRLWRPGQVEVARIAASKAARRPVQQRKPPARPRDSQRQRCYDAEEAVTLRGRRLDELAVLRQYVARVVADSPPGLLPPVRVGTGSGSRHARATVSEEGHAVQLPRWAREELVVLHELSHCAATHCYGWSAVAGHGPEWAGIYLILVRTVLGPASHAQLAAAFELMRVRVDYGPG